MSDLASLIARLEAAEGPSRELDLEIAAEIFPEEAPWPMPAYTASLDSAVSLVPEGWYWRCGDGDGVPPRPKVWAQVFRGNYRTIDGKGATPALALCLAALKARAQG